MLNEQACVLGTKRSCIRELFEYGKSRAAVVGAENIFDFSIGNPSIPAPAEVEETIRRLLSDTDSLTLHGYTSAVGDPQARQAIADDLNNRFGTDVTADELFLSCGAAPALCAVFKALTFPGAKILAIAPFFPEYKPFAESVGAEFAFVPPDVPDFQINLDALAQCLTEDTAALIVNSPNNPSGTVYTEETLKQLAALLRAKSREFGHPIYIIADEPYRELVYGGVRAPFIPTIYKDTVVCYSYSKSLSLPGERIGYIYVPRQAEDGGKLYWAVAGAARSLGHICAPTMWQKVIARCASLRPDLNAYDRNRQALYQGLVDAGYQVAKPDGAFYLFVKAPGGDANAFSEFAKQKDILLVPGDDFGCPGWLRLCYCVSYDRIQRSLPLFRALLEQWYQK